MDNALALIATLVLGTLGAFFVIQKPERLAIFLVISMFATRVSIDVGGLTLRLEHLTGMACIVALVTGALLPKNARTPLLLSSCLSAGLCILWFIGSALSTMAFAPEPSKSISVLLWCVLNFFSALWIAKNPTVWRTLLKSGAALSLVSVTLAILAWVAALAGVSTIGVQVDPTYGGYAAYVMSLEANILAGLLCLWGIVSAINPLKAISNRVRLPILVLTPLAILATHTRAALVAYVVGILIVLVVRKSSRKLVGWALVAGGFVGLVSLSGSGDGGLAKFSSLFDVSEGTGGLRNRVGTVALDEWWDSAGRLTGLGWNSFGQRHFDETQPALRAPGYIGNLPLQILYDGGLLSFVFVLIAALIVVYRFARQGQLGIVTAMVVPYLLFSFATSALWLLETWMFVGLAWGYYDRSPGKVRSHRASAQRSGSKPALSL
jgi:hypothetical protein